MQSLVYCIYFQICIVHHHINCLIYAPVQSWIPVTHKNEISVINSYLDDHMQANACNTCSIYTSVDLNSWLMQSASD